MKKALLLVIAALMVPSVALAAKSPPKDHHGKGAPKVTYVLKGTLSNYEFGSIYAESGTITIVVRRSNRHGRTLKGQTLTFPLDANSKISLRDGLTTITDGDRGIVKVRAAKKISAADLAAALQAIPARQVIDQGSSS
jgi:hypothetical protein